MTPRLQTARAEVARLIARYVPSHMHATGYASLTAAVAELEAAARVEDDKPADPPVTSAPVLGEGQTLQSVVEGMAVKLPHLGEPAPVLPIPAHIVTDPAPAPTPYEVGSAPAEASPMDHAPPELPSVAEAVQDALAPHDSTPEREVEPTGKSGKRSKK
jgi:hypothetical protein